MQPPAGSASAILSAIAPEAAAGPRKLLGVEWSLGAAVAAAGSPTLGRAFVTLKFKVADPAAEGGVAVVTADATVEQTRALHAALKEAAAALEKA